MSSTHGLDKLGLDELNRAAAAAGYAMAAWDDEPLPSPRAATEESRVSMEDSARGARQLVVQPAAATELAPRVALPAVPNALKSGAHTVRDTVYGYLGFGVPA